MRVIAESRGDQSLVNDLPWDVIDSAKVRIKGGEMDLLKAWSDRFDKMASLPDSVYLSQTDVKELRIVLNRAYESAKAIQKLALKK